MLTRPLKEGGKNSLKEKRQPNAVRVRRHTGGSQKCHSLASPVRVLVLPNANAINAPKTSSYAVVKSTLNVFLYLLELF
jgi:hypothetical protein